MKKLKTKICLSAATRVRACRRLKVKGPRGAAPEHRLMPPTHTCSPASPAWQYSRNHRVNLIKIVSHLRSACCSLPERNADTRVHLHLVPVGDTRSICCGALTHEIQSCSVVGVVSSLRCVEPSHQSKTGRNQLVVES